MAYGDTLKSEKLSLHGKSTFISEFGMALRSDHPLALCDNGNNHNSNVHPHDLSIPAITTFTHTANPKRAIILHGHMFKNAGSTLDWSLKRCFGGNFVDHRDDDAMRHSENYLANYLNTHQSVQALSSHWLTMPPPNTADLEIHLLMLIRHPLERCRSVYNFERMQFDDGSPGIVNAKRLSFADYIQWRLEPSSGPVLKNFHTRYCSQNYFGSDMNQLYEQATTNLQNQPAIGMVHRYAESMVLFEHQLQHSFPTIDLSWIPQNVGRAQPASTQQRLDAIADELGETFDALVEANQYDLKLFDYVEQNMNHQLAHIPRIEDRLSSLTQRNSKLQ